MKEYDPLALMVRVPTPAIVDGAPTACVPAIPAIVKPVIVSGSPSGSTALLSKSPAAPLATASVVSSIAVMVSTPSNGVSLSATTAICAVATALLKPVSSKTLTSMDLVMVDGASDELLKRIASRAAS